MATINDLIKNNISLSQQEIMSVSKAKDNLLEYLIQKSKLNELPTAIETFLIGSYSRDTKIAPLDDVDIMIVIGTVKKNEDDNHSIIKCDFNFNSDHYNNEDHISSKKMLELYKKYIKLKYSKSELIRNNEAINLYLSSYNTGFDLIPSFYCPSFDYYLIPTGGLDTNWKKSNPIKDKLILEELNTKHNLLLKNTIRIVKYWFKMKRIKKIRSYHFEAMCYYYFNQTPYLISSYKNGIETILKNINYCGYLKSCPDPTKLSGNLTSGYEEDDINNIISESEIALKKINESEEDFVKYVTNA